MTAKLPGLEDDDKRGYGPVYQGTARAIRRLTATGTFKDQPQLVDPDVWAGTIAQARSLAHTIDRKSEEGENGVPMSQRHLALDALMARLNPEVDDTESDTMGQLLEAFEREEARQRDASKAPHREE